jgi:hypothetical protein
LAFSEAAKVRPFVCPFCFLVFFRRLLEFQLDDLASRKFKTRHNVTSKLPTVHDANFDVFCFFKCYVVFFAARSFTASLRDAVEPRIMAERQAIICKIRL